MKVFERWVLGILILAIIVEIIILAPEDLGIGETAADGPVPAQTADRAAQVMHGVHLIETANSQKEWELWADKAVSFKGKGNWDVSKVRVVFFSDDGIEFHVTGDRGAIQVDTKDMLIEGNVVTKTSNDYLFFTESMVYNSKNRELKTAQPVRIEAPRDRRGRRMRLEGIGMLADLHESHIYVHRDVHGRKPLDSDRILKIRSQEAEMSGISKEATFKGQVEMEVDTLTVKGPRAKFKHGRSSNELKAIEVTGGVKVSDVDKWATSRTLEILLPQDKFIFRGSPKVFQNNDEIEGEEIVFLNGGKQVRINSGRATIQENRN